ncbi:MAG: hypothetical protein IJO91_03105, partial [Oscillospiraceae bacterium]|nr:hypothetical protein [Oscillospiraceae bacterium]
ELAKLLAKAITLDICIMEHTSTGGYKYTVADGRNISAHFELGTGEKLSDGTWAECTAMYYTDGKDKLALDVKDIVSVTVNGVVYHIG